MGLGQKAEHLFGECSGIEDHERDVSWSSIP
jgi:hypothetical protein